MIKPDRYRHIALENEEPYEAIDVMQLTQENFDQVKQWCHGQVVWTDDPVNAGNLEVGINFPGFVDMDRLSEGEFLVKIDEFVYKRVSAELFLSVYERV